MHKSLNDIIWVKKGIFELEKTAELGIGISKSNTVMQPGKSSSGFQMRTCGKKSQGVLKQIFD